MILQSTNQCGFLHLIISDTLRFPYNLHDEPKLVRIFISHAIEHSSFIEFTILNSGGGGGGVGEGMCIEGEYGGDVGGWGICRNPFFSTKQHSAEMHVLLPCHHIEEVQLVGYIQGLFSPCS